MKKGSGSRMTLNELPENMIKKIAQFLPPNQRIKPTSGTISVSIPLYFDDANVFDPPNTKQTTKIATKNLGTLGLAHGIGPPVIAIKLHKNTDNITRILFEDHRLARQKKPEFRHVFQPRSYVRNFLSEAYIPRRVPWLNFYNYSYESGFGAPRPKNSDRVLATKATKPQTNLRYTLKRKNIYRPENITDYKFSPNSPNGLGKSVYYVSYNFEVADKGKEKIKTRSQTNENKRTRTATNFMRASRSMRNALQSNASIAEFSAHGGRKIRNGVNLNPRGGILNPPKGRSELDNLIQRVRGMNAWQNRLNKDYETNKDHRSLLRYEDFVKNDKKQNNNRKKTANRSTRSV